MTSGEGDAAADGLREEVATLREQFQVVSELGMRLATEMDPTVLLPAIVSAARRFTGSEAGSLYVRKGEELHFAVAQNDWLQRKQGVAPPLPDIRLPLDATTLAGKAATEKRTLNIQDARAHPSAGAKYRDKFGYEVVSMLVVPMVDQRGEVSGVLQLMNALGDEGRPRPYPERSADLCGLLASHAATAMQIARLHAELAEVFDALVRYSVDAIDARDPCTAGHSSRVGAYARQLAIELGGFTDAELREIRFAAIFHDVGKIGVRECVLTKSTKLSADEIRIVRERFSTACESAWREHLASALERGADRAAVADEGVEEKVRRLEEDLRLVGEATTPGWLEDAQLARLAEVARRTFTTWNGQSRRLLTDEELDKLCVRRGNLTDSERTEIESHVTHSYRFLKNLPFPKDLARVPEIAYSHHEKLDGSGYPRRLKGDEISLQARIISVVDVFDALTAADRPYKKAIDPAKAVEIIERECEHGAWDPRAVAALRRLVDAGKLVTRRHASRAATDSSDVDRLAWRS